LRDNPDLERDINQIVSRIKDSPTEYHNYKLWSTFNGLRGVLKLAWHNAAQVPDMETIKLLAHRIVPEIFYDDDISSLVLGNSARQLPFEFTTVSSNLDLFRLSYVALNLKNERKLQIGIIPSYAQTTLVIYEQYDSNRQNARIVIVEYGYYGRELDFADVLALVEEPKQADSYRLPYQSVFQSKINSLKVPSNSYYPLGVKESIDTDSFAKLFKRNWIGSEQLDIATLHELHRLLESYQNCTVIHALELKS
jgi:hypothetical protein